MTVGSQINQLRKLAELFPRQDCPWEERPTFEPPVDRAALDEIEDELGTLLPNELRDFLTECNAIVAMSVHNGYWIGGIGQKGIDLSDVKLPLLQEEAGEERNFIPIATDGGGNAFLLLLKNGEIWKWNHETGIVIPITSSFQEFLARVALDWEHAVQNDVDWNYLV